MKSTNHKTPDSMHPKSEKQIRAGVKEILKAISDSQYAYDEKKGKIDFEVALIGISSTDLGDIISVFSAFCNFNNTTREAIEVQDLAIMLDHCYRTISYLKRVPKYGNTYYEIITGYYIEKRFKSADDTVDKIDGVTSRTTFFRRSNEACKLLHRIWFSTGAQYYANVLNEIIKSL